MRYKVINLIAKMTSLYANLLERRSKRLMSRRTAIIDWFCKTFVSNQK